LSANTFITDIQENERECIGVNLETLELHAVYKRLYFLLQVGIRNTNHARIHTRYMSWVLCLNVQ